MQDRVSKQVDLEDEILKKVSDQCEIKTFNTYGQIKLELAFLVSSGQLGI